MAKLPWKPWHEVVKLRDDLRSGELPLHMFAADLYEVVMQRAKRPLRKGRKLLWKEKTKEKTGQRRKRDRLVKVTPKNGSIM
jgi:hypothetical protein